MAAGSLIATNHLLKPAIRAHSMALTLAPPDMPITCRITCTLPDYAYRFAGGSRVGLWPMVHRRSWSDQWRSHCGRSIFDNSSLVMNEAFKMRSCSIRLQVLRVLLCVMYVGCANFGWVEDMETPDEIIQRDKLFKLNEIFFLCLWN